MRRPLFCLLIPLFNLSAMAQEIPRAAVQHRADLTRIAHATWGLDAPVPVFAAQIHQESGWNSQATSRVGAKGMTQFMPATAQWWCALNQLPAADCQPRNPIWAMRALVQYDFWLAEKIRAKNAYERLAFALSAYNGGLGWVNRDKTLASSKGLDSLVWFGSVERVNAGRSPANWQENRAYPERIMNRLQPLYAAWGRSLGPT